MQSLEPTKPRIVSLGKNGGENVLKQKTFGNNSRTLIILEYTNT